MAKHVRRSGAERREEIACAILRIAGEKGLGALTTASLAEAVGLTTGALFRHFANLDEMLDEAVRHAVGRIDGTFPPIDRPPLERILTLGANRVRLLGSDPGLAWLLLSDQARLALPPPALERLRDLVRRSRGFLLESLRQGAAEGTIRGDIPPEHLLFPVTGTIHGLVGMPGVHRLAGGGGPSDPDRVLESLSRLLSPPGASRSRRPSRVETNLRRKVQR